MFRLFSPKSDERYSFFPSRLLPPPMVRLLSLESEQRYSFFPLTCYRPRWFDSSPPRWFDSFPLFPSNLTRGTLFSSHLLPPPMIRLFRLFPSQKLSSFLSSSYFLLFSPLFSALFFSFHSFLFFLLFSLSLPFRLLSPITSVPLSLSQKEGAALTQGCGSGAQRPVGGADGARARTAPII